MTIAPDLGTISRVIRSFRSRQAEAIFQRRGSKILSGKLWRVAYRKLVMLHSAVQLQDLRVPPGNRLEALKAERSGQHSIRINERWRVCFRWEDGSVFDVEIVDYQ